MANPRTIWILPALVAGIALAGCGRKADTGPPKPVIAVSIYPVASLIGQLTDGWADVVTLLPEGAEEHDFELTADQVRQLNRADLLILVGNGLDPWAEPKPGMAGGAKQPTVLRMGDLLKDFDGGGPQNGKPNAPERVASDAANNGQSASDTANTARLGPPPTPLPDAAGPNNHLWLDPVLAGQFVEAVARRLSDRYPQHRTEIERSAAQLSIEMQQLDQKYRGDLSTVGRRELLTFHNAFDLIAHRYGLVIVARLTDIESDHHGGVTPDSYLAAIEAIKKYRLSAIYSEPEFSAQEVSSIERTTGVELLTLDPLGGPNIAGYRTYQEMMLTNLKTLVKGQGLGAIEPLPLPMPTQPAGHGAKKKPSGFDPDFDLPIRAPSTAKQPKPSSRPDLFSDPDLKFPPIVPSSPSRGP